MISFTVLKCPYWELEEFKTHKKLAYSKGKRSEGQDKLCPIKQFWIVESMDLVHFWARLTCFQTFWVKMEGYNRKWGKWKWQLIKWDRKTRDGKRGGMRRNVKFTSSTALFEWLRAKFTTEHCNILIYSRIRDAFVLSNLLKLVYVV